MRTSLTWLVLLALTGACSSESTVPDSGIDDAGSTVSDTSTSDAGDTDTATGEPDSDQPDSGPDTTLMECTSDPQCGDMNPCTEDLCNFEGKCRHLPIAGACDDGNPCTKADVCVGIECTGTAVDCGDGNPCTTDACKPESGSCVHMNNVLPCEDGNNCTLSDTCAGGACVPGAGRNCDDGNPCTDDACNLASGQCVNLANTDPCQDGDACTLQDTCAGKVCVGGPPLNCADDDPCTIDSCDPVSGFCVYDKNTGPCDDKNPCTPVDQCTAGKCVGSGTVNCDDGNPCTDDLCDATIGGCIHLYNTAPCNDGDLCTVDDTCAASNCLPGPEKVCDDENPCTDDSCGPLSGECLFSANAATCDDGDPCTQGDYCEDKKCEHGESIPCGDDEPCTLDGCDSATGECTHAIATGEPCDDANACTEDDACTAGGGCAGLLVICDDGDACTIGEQCIGDDCQGGQPVICDDDNPCTKDSCDPVSGACDFDPVLDLTPCGTPSACDTGSCIEGQCQTSPTGLDCTDDDPCTEDRCDTELGCSNEPIICGDATECLGGTCDSELGGCQWTTEDSLCDDGIECSLDACLPEVGCSTTYPEGCCDAKALIEDFENGLPTGWTVQNTGTYTGWQVVEGRNATTGTGSLYYGNPILWNYDDDGSPNSGMVSTPNFVVPNTAVPVLRFRMWRDIEKPSSFDKLQLTAQPSGDIIWTKFNTDNQQWHNVLVSLDAYAGQSISLRWEFDTKDKSNNLTTGVFIDAVRVLGCQ